MNIGFDAKRAFLNRSGLGNYSRFVIQSLAEHYNKNRYFLYTPGIKTTIFNPSSVPEAIVRLPEKPVHKLAPSIWRTFGITKELKTDNISVYHGLSGEIPHDIQKLGIPSVVTIHDLIFIRYPELYKPADRKIYEKKFRYACTNSDRIIAISKQTKTDIINYFGINENKIQVLYQGCQKSFQRSVPEEIKEGIKRKFNLPESYLLYVGTIEKRKNLLSIVKALHLSDIDIPLIVIGKHTKYSTLVSEYIYKNNLKNIHFLIGASNEELPAIYRMADLFIYPSVFEGFGIPIIEALYSGTPVITTKGGCFAEAGGPGTCYVDPNDPENIGESIKSLLADETRREKMKSEGLEYVKKFDHQTLSTQLVKLYQQLAHEH